METLRFTTAGSVDDGKSTLIGRLLLESQALYDDQLATLQRDSQRLGQTQLDLSLVTDGLRDEREQRITIDVAYRYFATPRRKFIIADCPGHLQYTRNMVTGASHSELAVILVDARHGLVTQSKRHAFLATLLGIPHLVVAINKMDLVGFDQEVFLRHCEEISRFAQRLDACQLSFLPLSALHGDNVVHSSPRLPWYQGPTLLHTLETARVGATRNVVDFRFPIQLVLRPNQDYRGYAGRVVSGRVALGDEVVVLPSGQVSRLVAIEAYQESRGTAQVGDSVVLRLAHHLDASRGDMIVRRHNLPTRGDELDVTLCWLHPQSLEVGKSYLLRHGTRRVKAQVERLDYRIDVDTMHRQTASSLELNDIGRVRLSLAEPLFFDPYRQNRETGCLLLIDPTSEEILAGGMIRSRTRHLEEWTGPAQREPLAVQTPPPPAQSAVLWLTGLSGAGKSTLAASLERRLRQRGVATLRLDGDDLRQGLCADLGFSPAERAENIRRAAQVAHLAWSQGLLVIGSLISPLAADRQKARDLFPAGAFLEIAVQCPLEVCQQRDPKGLYQRALRGEIPEFTGVSAPYQEPESPELRLDTSQNSPEECLQALLDLLQQRGLLPPEPPARP